MIYLSLDIETDGPIPGINSMLSLGAAAFDSSGAFLKANQINFEMLSGAHSDPATMKWWRKQDDEIWNAARKNATHPTIGMMEFEDFVRSFKTAVTPICYPSGFDWTFIYWYLMNFRKRSCLGMSPLDMKTYAACTLNRDLSNVVKATMPKSWFDFKAKHTHIAVDDAIEQGYLFFNMKKYRESL